MIDPCHRHRRARRAHARSADVCVPPFIDGTRVVIPASPLVNRRAQELVGWYPDPHTRGTILVRARSLTIQHP